MRWKPQMVVTVAAPRRMQGMSVILDDFQTNLDDFQTNLDDFQTNLDDFQTNLDDFQTKFG